MSGNNKKLTEGDIDEMLQKTLKAAELCYRSGKKELGDQIMATGSKLAILGLALLSIKNEKVRCPTCGRQMTTGIEIEFLKNAGMCIYCDHLQADRETVIN